MGINIDRTSRVTRREKVVAFAQAFFVVVAMSLAISYGITACHDRVMEAVSK